MNRKKVLIVTYYWPPSGGSGVQRWLKFVKYLPQAGWIPYVLTPENPSFQTKDNTLLKDVPEGVTVAKLPIWEPYDLFFRFSKWFGKGKISQSDFVSTGNSSLFKRVSIWIRGNFFVPDARVFWVKPAVSFLKTFLTHHDIQTIITTGPPHSMHLIGLRLKRFNPELIWIADFRDPWTEWDLLDTMSLTGASRKKHKQLENQVLLLANKVIAISPYHVRRLEMLSGRKVDLITNGFDEDDFKKTKKVRTAKFTICHTGVVDELRDPRPVMETIAKLCKDDQEFAGHILVKFIGHVNSAFKHFVKSDPVLSRITIFIDQLPHRQLLEQYQETDLQLLVLAHTVIAPGNLPGKFFEYLATGNPIFAIGPVDGDAAEILAQTNAGDIFDRSDRAGMAASLLNFHDAWLKGMPNGERNILAFTRKNLTQKLAELLESAGKLKEHQVEK